MSLPDCSGAHVENFMPRDMTIVPPGMVMYSDAWFDSVAAKYDIPHGYRQVVKEICSAFQLGNSHDPLTVYSIIEHWLHTCGVR